MLLCKFADSYTCDYYHFWQYPYTDIWWTCLKCWG